MIKAPTFSNIASRLAGFPALAVLFLGLSLFAPAPVTGTAEAAGKEDRAVTFMREAANALIAAQRQGTPEAFRRVVGRYGHVPEIGLYALGNYRQGLARSHRQSYYQGLAKFVGRYAATESPKYRVTRAAFKPFGIRDGRAILVDSTIYLADGSTYDVRWMLVPHRGTFKVRDAQVLGFWISPFLQTLFQNYIRENGGRVDALVMALNR